MKKKIPVVLAALVSAASLFCFSASAAENPAQAITLYSSTQTTASSGLTFISSDLMSNGNARYSFTGTSTNLIVQQTFYTNFYEFEKDRRYNMSYVLYTEKGTTLPSATISVYGVGEHGSYTLGTFPAVASSNQWNNIYTFNISVADVAETVSLSRFELRLNRSTTNAEFNLWVSNTIPVTVKTATDEIIDGITDEDFGYEKPDSPNTDEGLDAGGNLLDEMTDTVDEFNATVNEKTQVMIDNVTKVKPLVDGVFDIIPLPITLCVSGVVVFLVIRKVVGR